LDLHVAKETGLLVHGGDISRADPVPAVTRLLTSVYPKVLLSDCHNIFNTHVLFGSKHGNFTDVLSVNTKALVESLSKEVVGNSWFDILNQLEHNRYKFLGENRRPVVVSRVDPAVKEVMVSIGKTFSLMEEVICLFLVKFSALLSIERMVSHIEIGFFGLLNPVCPLGALETVRRPVPGVL